MVNQSAADHDDNMGSVINCINNSGRFVQSAVPEFDDVNLGNEAKAEARDVGCDHAVQSAVPESDGPKLGNEASSEALDVRRDKTKAGQSAGLSGTMEVERRSYAVDQAAGIQSRPRSPTPAATGLDADSAALRVPESPMCGTPDPYEEMNMDSVTQCVGALREAAAVNAPECWGPELGAASASNHRATPASGERWADLSDECGEAGWTGRSASRTEPSSVEAATFREAYGPVDSTSAVRIIADVWADLVCNDEDAKSQQLLKTAMEHPGVDKETLREALLDTVRQMVEEVRVEPSPMTTAGKEVLSDPAPKLASKKGKTRLK